MKSYWIVTQSATQQRVNGEKRGIFAEFQTTYIDPPLKEVERDTHPTRGLCVVASFQKVSVEGTGQSSPRTGETPHKRPQPGGQVNRFRDQTDPCCDVTPGAFSEPSPKTRPQCNHGENRREILQSTRQSSSKPSRSSKTGTG